MKDRLEKTLDAIVAPLTLDVATGSGGYASHLRHNVKGCGTIAGIDISIEGLLRSKESLKEIPDLYPICMDSSRMALGDSVFDMVCISNSLHHMDDLSGTLQEMLRVLKPGGYFLASEMYRDDQTPAQMSHVLMHDWWAEIDRACGVPHFRTFQRSEILDIIADLELEDTVKADYAFLDTDPMTEESIARGNKAIDAYIEKAGNLQDARRLRRRGNELRKRLSSEGLHGSTIIAVLGRKKRS